MHHNLWMTIFLHLAGCKAKDVVWNYLKKVAREVTVAIVAPFLAPIERFIETVSTTLFYSLAVAALIVFARAFSRWPRAA